MSERHVLVTTDNERRGVFGGVLVEQNGSSVVLHDARMAVYWPPETHGVLGLAADGPKTGAKISPKVPRIELDGVTAVMDMTPEAVAAWESEPWG